MVGEPLQGVLAALPDAKQQGKGWIAHCPAHDDRTPSLSITEGDDGRMLLHCHAGCRNEDIMAAIGLTMRDLMPNNRAALGLNMSDLMPEDNNGDHKPPQRRAAAATYDYTNAAGDLLYQVVRFEPKGFAQRRPDGAGGWAWNLDGVGRVLYRLPELQGIGGDSFVFVPEGEKDADKLGTEGLIATTCPGGAGKWALVDDEPLHGHHVVVVPDNDPPGRKHAQEVAAVQHSKATSVRVLELPGLPDKGDVSDWLDAGGDGEELVRLAEGTPVWSPEDQADDQIRATPIGGELAGIEFLPASALGSGDAIDWLWHGWLARGHTTLLVGLWKAGKSTLLAHLLSATQMGGDVGGQISKCKVCVVTEEGTGLWARRRDDIGIGDNVVFVIRPFKGRPSGKAWQTFVKDLGQRVLAGEFDMVVIDTWASPCPDENDSASMMAALTPLHHITQANGAVLLIHHPRKGDADQGQASRGSGALPGFVDVIIELRRYDPKRSGDTRRVLKGLSRFDETPSEIVLDLRGGGYQVIGNKADAKREDRVVVIDQILRQHDRSLTVDELHDQWPDGGPPKPGIRTLREDLKQDGHYVQTGSGHKGDPHRYGLRFDSGKPHPLKPESNLIPVAG